MEVIARIKPNGTLQIKGEVHEVVNVWEEFQVIEEGHEIDKDIEIIEEMLFEDFVKILLGLESQEKEIDRIYFDSAGNLYTNSIIEENIGGVVFDNQKVYVVKIEEGVNFY